MKRKRFVTISLIVFLVALITGLWESTLYFIDLPNRVSQHETIVLGQNHFVPGSRAALRVVARDSKDATPLENAKIRVYLKPRNGGEPITLYNGTTDNLGSADVAFLVPPDAQQDQTLIIETTSDLGSDTVERAVTLERDFRILLTTDKPIYQPGQQIHIRVLVFSTFDRIPAADSDVEISITDGKGNKVFRETLRASEWGVGAIDFRLASEVNTGLYKITATMGSASTEKTVRVEHYVLPKFDIAVETEKTFYLPGDRVRGSLRAEYFYGKPVAGGEIIIQGYTYDVERIVSVDIQGVTNEEGVYEFEFILPDYLTGIELEGGLGLFYIQVAVTDLAQHTEIENLSLPISRDTLVIEAIPEGGQFKPGVENLFYVLTSYPDGSPAETTLNITFRNTGNVVNVSTGKYGMAEVTHIPNDPWESVFIQARDQMGNTSSKEFFFDGEWSEETILIRPDKPVYIVGERMNITVLTSRNTGTVYLDIIREGQTITTQALLVRNGTGQVGVMLTPDHYGTLELHGYKILRSGQIARDIRLVVVDDANDLNLSINPHTNAAGGISETQYEPGEIADIDIKVTDQDGNSVQSAIGLAVVDESVYAQAESDPGFAKLYFMLENDLLRPRYDLHGYSLPDLVGGIPISNQDFVRAIEVAANASLAETIPKRTSFSLVANSHEEAMNLIFERQSVYFRNLSKGLFGLFLGLAILYLILAVVAVIHEKMFWRSLFTTFGILGILFLTLVLWPHPWANNLMDKLGIFLDWLSWRGEIFFLILGLLAATGLITLIVYVIRQKDRLLGWKLILIPVSLVVLSFMVFSLSESNQTPGEGFLLLGLFGFALIPFSFLLRFTDFVWSRKVLPSIATLTIVIFIMVVGLLGPTLGFGRWSFAAQDGEVFFTGEANEMRSMNSIQESAVAELEETIVEKEDSADMSESTSSSPGEPPRLRQYFPETMYWLPEAITDQNGELQLAFQVADSITTWRMTALASAQDGRLGSATAPLRVFQDFFIDLDLPLALTVGDEVSVPVGLFNYLNEPQTIRLEIEGANWFELADRAVKEIEIAPNDITVVYFRIRALHFGVQPFKVTAWGSQMSDAIQKDIQVFPDGKEIHLTMSDRLNSTAPVHEIINVPADAIPGSQKLTVKIYPGIVSQVVEGLENILRMPYGCFEQTSSTTYPNVLVLDYLRFTNQSAPEVQFKAEEYINLGYQRLTTFEVGGSGGFSLFGDPPADRMLTAYGLQEFGDMSRIHHVDQDLLQRAADWLFSQQDTNGSWEIDRGPVHEETWANLGDDRLPVTAYIVWSLADAGFATDPHTQAGLDYVKENSVKAEDPYVLALIANAMVAVDTNTGAQINDFTLGILDRLAVLVIHDGDVAIWQSGVATFMGSEGQTGSIETTALTAYAFLRANRYPELVNASLTSLIQQKDSFGTWYSTQATVLALKALIQSVRAGAETVNATVSVTLNNAQTRVVQVTHENFDVVQLLTFEDINIGLDNIVDIRVEGEGNLMYQVSGNYYLPWEALPKYPELTLGGEEVDIELVYDRTRLAVNDTLSVQAVVTLNQGQAESALIDLGLPPGFSVEIADLAALVARFDDIPEDYAFATIERFELTGRQILIYVSNLKADYPLEFEYRLRAKFPLSAQTPASNVYDYYNPDVSGEAVPLTLIVTE